MSLHDEWKRFVRAPRANPPLQGDELTRFIEKLSREGKLKAYTEAQWAEVLKEYPMTPEEIGQFMEQVASYLPTGDVDPEGEEPHRW